MSLRIATGTDGSVKERKGLKRKFAAYAGLAFGLILIAGLFAGCGKKDTADADVDLSIFAAKSLNGVMDEICAAYTRAHPNVNFRNNSPYNDGFSYEGWAGYYDLVKLNLHNDEVVNYLLDCARFWIDEFDIDGLRLDAADCIDIEFFKKLKNVC